MVIPGETTDSGSMSSHRSYPLAILGIPDLHHTPGRPNGQRAALVGPFDSCHCIIRFFGSGGIAEFCDFASLC